MEEAGVGEDNYWHGEVGGEALVDFGEEAVHVGLRPGVEPLIADVAGFGVGVSADLGFDLVLSLAYNGHGGSAVGML